MQKVEGKGSLMKDPASNSVMNTDESAFRAAKALKRRILEEKQEKEELRSRVDKLESMLTELLAKETNNNGK